jgi:digeranylgeranylglycerophospholipid reductase
MGDGYDIVVVGAGPAGSRAAQAAALRGAKVLLIDRRQRIGAPVQCGEFVPQWISRCAPFSSQCVIQTIETMVTHLPDHASSGMRSPGYMLDRSLFDRELAASAIEAGAEISIETRAKALSPEGLIVETGTRERIVKSKVIIGADGVHSSVARWVGQPIVKTIVALQYQVVIPQSRKEVEIFFHKDYEGGYAWFFPKGRTANVGVGVIPEKASLLPDLLGDFTERLKESKRLSRVEIISKTGGSIPCEKPRKTVFGNILLAGDAAGHCHPVTGAGILNAVMGGEMAGRIAAEAILREDPGYLGYYETEWRETFGKSLAYGASKREILEENWNHPAFGFEDLIRKTWVGFKEYYADRKKGEPWSRE